MDKIMVKLLQLKKQREAEGFRKVLIKRRGCRIDPKPHVCVNCEE